MLWNSLYILFLAAHSFAVPLKWKGEKTGSHWRLWFAWSYQSPHYCIFIFQRLRGALDVNGKKLNAEWLFWPLDRHSAPTSRLSTHNVHWTQLNWKVEKNEFIWSYQIFSPFSPVVWGSGAGRWICGRCFDICERTSNLLGRAKHDAWSLALYLMHHSPQGWDSTLS